MILTGEETTSGLIRQIRIISLFATLQFLPHLFSQNSAP